MANGREFIPVSGIMGLYIYEMVTGPVLCRGPFCFGFSLQRRPKNDPRNLNRMTEWLLLFSSCWKNCLKMFARKKVPGRCLHSKLLRGWRFPEEQFCFRQQLNKRILARFIVRMSENQLLTTYLDASKPSLGKWLLSQKSLFKTDCLEFQVVTEVGVIIVVLKKIQETCICICISLYIYIMANCWFGLVVWIPGLESQSTKPNPQLAISWIYERILIQKKIPWPHLLTTRITGKYPI